MSLIPALRPGWRHLTGHPPCEGQLIKRLPLLGTEGLLQAPVPVLILLSCNCFLGLPTPEIRTLSIYSTFDVSFWVYKYQVKQERKDVFHIYLLTHTHTHTHTGVRVRCACVYLEEIIYIHLSSSPGIRSQEGNIPGTQRSRARAGEGVFVVPGLVLSHIPTLPL